MGPAPSPIKRKPTWGPVPSLLKRKPTWGPVPSLLKRKPICVDLLLPSHEKTYSWTCPSLPRENHTCVPTPSLLKALLPGDPLPPCSRGNLAGELIPPLSRGSLPEALLPPSSRENLPGDLLPPSSREHLPGDLPLHLRLPYLNILPRSEIEKIYHKMPKSTSEEKISKYFFLVLSNRTFRLINLIFNNIYLVLFQGKVRLRQFWAERYSKDMLGAKRHGQDRPGDRVLHPVTCQTIIL